MPPIDQIQAAREARAFNALADDTTSGDASGEPGATGTEITSGWNRAPARVQEVRGNKQDVV